MRHACSDLLALALWKGVEQVGCREQRGLVQRGHRLGVEVVGGLRPLVRQIHGVHVRLKRKRRERCCVGGGGQRTQVIAM
eukprot:4877785-Prymnesium_polylepis.1